MLHASPLPNINLVRLESYAYSDGKFNEKFNTSTELKLTKNNRFRLLNVSKYMRSKNVRIVIFSCL